MVSPNRGSQLANGRTPLGMKSRCTTTMLSSRLLCSSSIVDHVEFETGILKIQNNLAESLTDVELNAIECFRPEDPDN